MQHQIEITLTKYHEHFTKRTKDQIKLKWFSFPNDLLLHPDFYRVTGEELKWFIWCASICSKCNHETIRLDIEHACGVLRLQASDFHSMCEKLKGKQVVVGSRPDGGLVEASTLHNITEHNITEQDNTPPDVEVFFDFWNNQENLPKAVKLSKARKSKINTRLKEANLDDWKKAISLANKTDFLIGRNDRGWRADLDWFIAKEENRLKVVEGKYKSNNSKAATVFDTAKEQIRKIKAGEL